ncbi:MAG: LamG domain-containing protein [Rhodocyclaceae bacterium]|nr:LamG domain-containing protein [Rhodocyclaceae bacterium]
MPTNPGQTNLNAWWDFNETSGTRVDAHGSFDLTDSNTVGYGTGKKGNASYMLWGSVELFYRTDEAGLNFTGDWTLSGWIKSDTIDNTTRRVLTKYKSSPNSGREFLIQVSNVDNCIGFYVYKSDGTGVSARFTSSALSANTWYHVAVWCDHTNNVIGISVNGGTPVTTAWTGTVNNGAARLVFGNYDGAASGGWDGYHDEWCWYGRVLTSDERDWLYNSGTGRTLSETVSATTLTPSAVAPALVLPAPTINRTLIPAALVLGTTLPTHVRT